jgi:thiol-disulfide isomerase/thioredoxin
LTSKPTLGIVLLSKSLIAGLMKNMKKTTILAILFLMSVSLGSYAKSGYDVHLNFTNIKDSMVFLVHYYGKGLPTIYKRDSVRLDKKGRGDMHSTDSTFVGGIYMVLLSDHKTNFEFLLNAGDNITITATVPDTPEHGKPAEQVKLSFKNSDENVRFQKYVDFLKDYSAGQQKLTKKLAEAKTADDTAAVRKEASKTSHDLTNYRRKYIKENPNTLLSSIFNALEVPEIPEGEHLLEDGKTKDSTFAYRYYKGHFWDGYDLQDDRLIHTPLLDPKLDEYFSKLVLPWPDSVEHEADYLLRKAKGSKDNFKYVLWWVTRYVENSKVMGMDEAFVYLVENYYMKGEAFWLTNEELTKYYDRAQKIAPNVIGNIAPEVKVPNIFTKTDESMMAIKSKYTLVVFYSPSCGHCQKELPELDSAYEAVLKDKGVKIMTVATEGDEKAITDFLTKHKLDQKWINCWDPEHVGDWRGKYDVYSTPTIYLLDEKKIIRGKRLDHSNISSVIDMTERKARDRAAKGIK